MKKLSDYQFKQRARQTHGLKYDYSAVVYTGSQSKIRIICPYHGAFDQLPAEHLRGFGCDACRRRKPASVSPSVAPAEGRSEPGYWASWSPRAPERSD